MIAAGSVGSVTRYLRHLVLFLAASLAACGSSSPPRAAVPQPSIELTPRGGTWAADAIEDGLADVSNSGGRYTGEIDLYAILIPAPGRLQISLSWEHAADYDLFLAADPQGEIRLAEGLSNDDQPEYIGADVAGGQTVYVIVAGWEGEPGPYTLETILLPTGEPIFSFVEGPDLNQPWPANRPLVFTFNKDLDPNQRIEDRILLVGQGRFAEGSWCIDGPTLTFHPRLPVVPGDPGGLEVGASHTLQFPSAARGVRAATGEYLMGLAGAVFDVADPVDLTPGEPPRATAVLPDPDQPYDGSAITIAISEPLSPETLFPELVQVAPDGREFPLAFTFQLTQRYFCSGAVEVRLLVAPGGAPTPGAVTRLRITGALGLSGDPAPQNGLTGPAPQPGGGGVLLDFSSP